MGCRSLSTKLGELLLGNIMWEDCEIISCFSKRLYFAGECSNTVCYDAIKELQICVSSD